jgi:hypothetical protein
VLPDQLYQSRTPPVILPDRDRALAPSGDVQVHFYRRDETEKEGANAPKEGRNEQPQNRDATRDEGEDGNDEKHPAAMSKRQSESPPNTIKFAGPHRIKPTRTSYAEGAPGPR